MSKKSIFFVISIALMMAGCNNFPVEKAVSAMEGKDATAPIQGCGNQPIAGFTYCRVVEGEVAKAHLTVYGPVTNCDREEGCVHFKIFYPEGDVPTYSQWIKKGETSARVYWKDLIKSEVFTKGHRGYWPVKYWVYWKHPEEGNEMVSETDGEIRLRVIDKEYTPLHESATDPNYAWSFVAKDGTVVNMTTGLRTYVKGK